MTCYLISRGGESIALVADVAMARAIVGSEPPGGYLVEPVDVPDTPPVQESHPSRHAPAYPDGRYRRRSSRVSRRWTYGPATAAFDRARHRVH